VSLEGPDVHSVMWYVFCVVLAIHCIVRSS
jgi:hypothetical protein